MDHRQKVHDFCKTMLLLALIFRLCTAGIPDRLLRWLSQPDNAAFLLYLETGQTVRFSASSEALPVFFRESPPPQAPQPETPVFSPEDADGISLSYLCSLRPELDKLLTSPLRWDLRDGAPAVLILHTHTTESYTQTGEDYTETAHFRTLDERYNMLSIGDRVAELLEEGGVSVIHDREIHDYPSYNGSYTHARNTLTGLLEQYPTLRLVLDLHRDASGSVGKQLRTLAQIDGVPCAQLMLVLGTNASGLTHENWQENLSLGLKLHAQLENLYPGIMRPLSLRAQRFNQDMRPGALLIEVGAAGNTHAEALLAAEKLAQGILSLAGGCG